jgi:hypothetical protein
MTFRTALIVTCMFVPWAAALGDQLRLSVNERDCRWLVVHTPDEDVHFKAGVDVRGKSVVPADLPGNRTLTVQDQLLLNLDIPLAMFLGRSAAGRLARADVNVGQVSIDTETREVFYNGLPVTPEGQSNLTAACRDVLRDRR